MSELDELEEFWVVRIVLNNAVMTVASRTEPRVCQHGCHLGSVRLDLVEDDPRFDTLAFIRWGEVDAVTWRRKVNRQPRGER